MASTKYPTKCSECSSVNISPAGGTMLNFANEGKNEQKVVIAFVCNDCGNLMFKLPKGE